MPPSFDVAKRTVELSFGVWIDEYVFVNFDGFTAIVEALGGIEVNVPGAIDDPEYPTENYGTRHLRIEAGRQTMNGEETLASARTRNQVNVEGRTTAGRVGNG